MTSPKGFPLDRPAGTGWNVFDGHVAFPVAVLSESALAHNGTLMRDYCASQGVSIAPHGKTTMAPALFRRQLADGAWAITAATTWQAKAMYEAGVPRILIANEVVVPAEARWLGGALEDGLDLYCYVDSVAGVEILSAALDGAEATLKVLVEVGVDGGRTGVRGTPRGLEVAEAANRSRQLALTGVAGFEGIIGPEGDRTAAERVDAFLTEIVDFTRAIADRRWFQPSPDVVVSAGGSAYFDYVVARFSHLDLDLPTRIVIRSGCYITHDDGAYDGSSPMGAQSRVGGDAHLMPAIEIWGVVLSRPEPSRALVGIGKRDASADGLLPLAKKVRRRASDVVEDIQPIRVSAVNDQHAYLDLDEFNPLEVGDLIGFGISHPCTTFDKWRALAIVDDDYNVIELVETLF